MKSSVLGCSLSVLVLISTVLSLVAPGVAGAEGGQDTSARTAPSAELAEAVEQRLGQLHRALRDRLERVSRRLELRQPADLEPDAAERIRRNLVHLERRIQDLAPAEREPLAAKARAVSRLARLLESLPADAGPDHPLLERYRPDAPKTAVKQALIDGAAANDDCSDAQAIGNGTFLGTTVGASGDGTTSCDPTGTSPDVWFRYTPPSAGEVFVDTLGSDFDTVLSVHTDCPGVFSTELACNDNAAGFLSSLSFFASPDDEVWIRVGGFAGDSGNFVLNVGSSGAISGTVTHSVSGEPVAGSNVEIYDHLDRLVSIALTDASGEYLAAGLATGDHYAVAGTFSDDLPELYEEMPCSLCIPSDGTPIAVTLGETTEGIDFTLDRGGILTGRVTDAATGQPIESGFVDVYVGNPTLVGSGFPDGNGDYQVSGLAPGDHFALANVEGYRGELFDDVPCPGGACNPATGTPIAVSANATTSGIDFALERLGSISGRVTEAATGDPIPFILVDIHNENGSFEGTATTDGDGFYTAGGLPTGTYIAHTIAIPTYLDEVYDDVPCLSGCDLFAGTPIAVTINQTTNGIDFALERLGAISGVVTDAITGLPVPFSGVEQFGPDGFFTRFEQTDAQGRYTFDGVVPGTHFVRTADRVTYLDELYDDIPCPRSECEPVTGTPVTVEIATTTSGIDFALTPLGSFSGRVTDQATGLGIEGIDLLIVDAGGNHAGDARTISTGHYTVPSLAPGNHFVRTFDSELYLDELYLDIPCLDGDCLVLEGTPVPVANAANTPGIDFQLQRLGSISGRVREQASALPIQGLDVTAFEISSGAAGFADTRADGTYTIEGLPAGDYLVRIVDFSRQYLEELYDDVPCPGGACDLDDGLPVPVDLEATVGGIDFELARLGSISGRVTRAATGTGLASAIVDVIDPGGFTVSTAVAAASGSYTATGLLPGDYSAIARGPSEPLEPDYVQQLYDGIPCPLGACDPTTGTAIAVALDGDAAGVDFALELGGAITGTVTDAATGSFAQVGIIIWRADGTAAGALFTDPFGRYQVGGLPGGTYFVSTDSIFYENEVYDDLPCPGGVCDPTTGTPVEVVVGETTLRIDFELEPRVVPTCFPSATELCLNDDRFRVQVTWRDFMGNVGVGTGFELTSDTGYFWFFDPGNVELVVKVLDGCFDPFDTFWVFAGGLTDVEVELLIEDTATGEQKRYTNQLGTAFAPIQDTGAFATCSVPRSEASVAPEVTSAPEVPPQAVSSQLASLLAELELGHPLAGEASAAEALESPGGCVPDSTTLCLAGDRFEVVAQWDTGEQSGDGQAIPLTGDTGYFWFFSPENVEAVIKVLDACALPDFQNFWVYGAGLTDVEVTLRVRDTETSEELEFSNPLGTDFQPIRETGAFRSCP